MSKLPPPSSQYDVDIRKGPGIWPLNHFTSDKGKKEYADTRQKERDAESDARERTRQAELDKNPVKTKTSVSPTIEPPKRPKGYYDNVPKILPKYLRTDEDPKSRKFEVPSELRKSSETSPKSSKSKSDFDDLTFGQAFSRNRKSGAKEFTWRGNKYNTKLREDANVVSGGNIAGLGVGPDGEPGIPKRRKPRIVDLVTFMKR